MMFRVLALLALPVLAYYLVRSLNRRFAFTPRQNRLLFLIVAAMLVIGVLVLLGRVPVHFILAPLGAAGAFLLRFLPMMLRLAPFWGMFKSRVASGRPAGSGGAGAQNSRIRTEYVEMELDHNSGNMDGQILKGNFAGRVLGDLSLGELLTLYHEASPDADSAQVLEAYLDRHHEDWREQAARQGFGHSDERGTGSEESSMSRPLALEILGLEEGVDRKAIVAAHRSLMQKLHPDRGGSDYLAQKINAAKDFLLSTLQD